MTNDYLLSQGQADVHRLGLINQVYGPSTEAIFRKIELEPGLRVVEIGCGSGNMTCWLAEQVGPGGKVVGIDFNADSLEQARQQAAARKLTNIEFQTGDINALALPAGTFDIAYCRCVLMHQKNPEVGLGQMAKVVRSGGTVLCEELDLSRCIFDPPAPHMQRMMELNVAIGDHHGVPYRLGSTLNSLFQKAGFKEHKVAIFKPTILRGSTKQLLTLSFQQYAPKLLETGLARSAEVDKILTSARRTDADTTTLYGMPPMSQGWVRIP
ncbi:class I SAM-dependent methyltransferase [soil metagenome]